jgi:hypothetical protein
MGDALASRTFDATPDDVQAAMEDLEAFIEGAEFDEVGYDGDTLVVNNSVGLFGIELVLDVVDADGGAVAYEQREGVFEGMYTEYTVESDGEETTVTAWTEFTTTDLAVIGTVLDETVVTRQRRTELTAQFD